MRGLLLWCACVLWVTPARAVDLDLDLDSMSLEDLLERQTVSVASQKAQRARTSPGVISVITAEDLKAMGARDLIDALYLVPGFNFNGEIYQLDGMSARGIYAYEGRMLFQIDGIMMNEVSYGNISFGNRYPIDQIEKIEIIRGPGSAVYGGFAELAVINVTTKGAAQRKGSEAGIMYSEMTETFGHKNISARVSGGETFKYDAAAFYGRGNRSDRNMQIEDTSVSPADVFDVEMANSSQLNPAYFNGGLQAYGFSARAIVDMYDTTNMIGYGYNKLMRPVEVGFHSYNLQLKYDWKPDESLLITPTYTYKYDTPWKITDDYVLPIDNTLYYDIVNQRHTSQLKASWDIMSNLNMIAGGEYMSEESRSRAPTGTFSGGKRRLSYSSFALFSQALMESQI